ncbi:MAG: hypothetical protein HS115_09240 [Spirochaetales bacterium]|nr:hypothetical protein [Spirochaetales bacterium]
MVKSSIIWHVSRGRSFPLELRRGPFPIEIREASFADLENLTARPGEIHLCLIQVEKGGMEAIGQAIHRAKSVYDIPKILLVPSGEARNFPVNPELLPRTLILEDSIQPQNLAVCLEQQLVLEYYRSIVYTLSHEIRQKTEAYEKLLALSQEELKAKQSESRAYAALMDYHVEHQAFADRVQKARESMDSMQNSELLQLSEQLEAYERLSAWRDQEMKSAEATLQATSTALDLSTKENLEKEKLLNAMDRLRNFTEQELQDLLTENNELRARLGMPPRFV